MTRADLIDPTVPTGPAGLHLSYCTNVHPAEDLAGVIEQLDRYAGPARVAAGLAVLGVGLWVPADLAAQLALSAQDRAELRDALRRNGLELRTINAFPYAAFHAPVVKLGVYSPDWTDPARATYTLDCARVLADLLPDGADGSISTLPLGWRTPWDEAADDAAATQLALVGRELRQLADTTGHTVRLAIEPEPGCVLDTVADVVAWLSRRTRPEEPAATRLDPSLVGICLDTCHLAVSFADPTAAVTAISEAGLRVVKIQASAALELADPADSATRSEARRFVEPRYLHQVRELAADGTVLATDDLDQALDGLPAAGPWRVHYHVPLHHTPRSPLRSTTEVLVAAVQAVLGQPYGDQAHLDIETYTWSVLPHDHDDSSGSAALAGPSPDPTTGVTPGQVDLVSGLAAELRWAVAHLPVHPEPGAAPPSPSAATYPSSQRRVATDKSPLEFESAGPELESDQS